jgi:hypothetical protein
MATALESFSRDIAAKPQAEQAKAVKEAVDALPEDQKKAVAQALGVRLPEPDQTTSNKVWLIIIWCFAIVMMGAVLVLGISVFAAPVTGGTKPETILTVFTTVTAFLAGLFAPSPVAKNAGG